jgi:hypothetical protein
MAGGSVLTERAVPDNTMFKSMCMSNRHIENIGGRLVKRMTSVGPTTWLYRPSPYRNQDQGPYKAEKTELYSYKLLSTRLPQANRVSVQGELNDGDSIVL